MSVLRVKLFFGTKYTQADDALDAWLEKHPEYEVCHCRMITQADDIYKHALLVMYSERIELNHEQSGDATCAERED